MQIKWKQVNINITSSFNVVYEVSNFGDVRSLSRSYIDKKNRLREFNGKTLKRSLLKSGYYTVSLPVNNKRKRVTIHRLVALTFLPNTEYKPCVNHKDGDKKNNNINNLEWCTYKENLDHALKNGLIKTLDLDIGAIIELYPLNTTKEIADLFGISTTYINKLLKDSGYDLRSKGVIRKPINKILLFKLKNKGLTNKEIGDIFDVNASTISRRLKSLRSAK